MKWQIEELTIGQRAYLFEWNAYSDSTVHILEMNGYINKNTSRFTPEHYTEKTSKALITYADNNKKIVSSLYNKMSYQYINSNYELNDLISYFYLSNLCHDKKPFEMYYYSNINSFRISEKNQLTNSLIDYILDNRLQYEIVTLRTNKLLGFKPLSFTQKKTYYSSTACSLIFLGDNR